MSEMKIEETLAKASDWVGANADHAFADSIKANIATAEANPEHTANMIAAIKAMLKNVVGNPFGRGNSVFSATAKTTFDTGSEELNDLLASGVETHPTAIAMLLVTKRGEGNYDNTSEFVTSIMGSVKRVLTERVKQDPPAWDGTVDGL